MVQFGVSGSPQVSAVYNAARLPPMPGAIIPDDPVRAPNNVGYVSFSCSYDEAMSHATNRTTELYINAQACPHHRSSSTTSQHCCLHRTMLLSSMHWDLHLWAVSYRAWAWCAVSMQVHA